MTEPVPNWAMRKFAVLWKSFGKKEFSHKNAQELLSIEWQEVSILIYRLKKKGWITVKKDQDDRRKRSYQLVEPNKVIELMK